MQPKALLGWRFALVEILTLICVLAGLWRLGRALVQALRQRRLDLVHAAVLRGLWPHDALDWSVLLFALYATFSLLWARSLGVAVREWRVVVFEPALFFWLVRRGLGGPILAEDQPVHWQRAFRLVDALLVAATTIALYGLYQWFFTTDIITAEGVRRIRGVYGSPNNLSLFLGRIIPIALALALPWFSEQSKRHYNMIQVSARRFNLAGGRSLFALVALVPLTMTLFLTFSRGAWLLGVPTALLYIAWQRPGGPRKAILGGVALAALALVPFAATERIRSTLDVEGGTWFVRLKLWQATLTMLSDGWNWLTGVGLDNFLYVYQSYRLPEAWREPDLSHPHNLILHPWVALGLLGLLLMLWQQQAFWRAVWRRTILPVSIAPLLLGLTASMVDFLAHGLIDNSYFLVDMAYIYMLTLALVALLPPSPDTPSSEGSHE